MSSIATAVFKATIGLLLNKGRDKVAEKLKEGDTTDQKLRDLIVREIDDVKTKLNGLARKDLLAAIDYFEEGLVLLSDVLHSTSFQEFPANAKTVSLSEKMGNLELTGLHESMVTVLANAKERFKDARRKATEAYNDEALKTSDRVQAMEYRVMATMLETVDNPSAALSACALCIKRLHSLSAVQNCFTTEFKKGLRGRFSKDERREIISAVCRVNRIFYDVTFAIYGFGNKEVSPCVEVNTEDEKVNPLFDARVAKALRKQGIEQCFVPWSFGQEGQEEHKLKNPRGIVTNTLGQFVIADRGDRNVKVFESNGKFMYSFSPSIDDLKTVLDIHVVATDRQNNTYVLVGLKRLGAEASELLVFDNTSEFHHKFRVREGLRPWYLSSAKSSMIVNDDNKVLLSGRLLGGTDVVDVYETDGQFVRSFGEGVLKCAWDITAANEGHVMVVDKDDSHIHVFSEMGDHLFKFKVDESFYSPKIAFHQACQYVAVAGEKEAKEGTIHFLIYSKNGEFIRSVQLDKEGPDSFIGGVTITPDGRIAVAIGDLHHTQNNKVLVV